MTGKSISKVLEIENCETNQLIEALYTPSFWEEISPVDEISAKFTAPNVLYTDLTENIGIIKIPIEMSGELVFMDKGLEPSKGHLIEFNVRNNKDIRRLEGNLRLKQLTPDKVKAGIFIHKFELESEFLNLIGRQTSEFILRTKLSELLRNVEKLCKSRDLDEL
jgi:hypothetical protein